MRGSLFTPTFCLVLGLAASAAHACGGHLPPDRYAMLPGMTLLRPDMIFLLPILSGTLERPFYALAGLRDATSTLAFSIQANFVAMAAGAAATAGGVLLLQSPEALMLGVIVMPVIGGLVKAAWLGRLPQERPTMSIGGSVFLAHVVSTLTIATIPFWMNVAGTDTYAYAERVRHLQAGAILLTLLASIVTLLALFARFRRPARADRRRGFEVGPTHAAPLPIARPA